MSFAELKVMNNISRNVIKITVYQDNSAIKKGEMGVVTKKKSAVWIDQEIKDDDNLS